MSILNALQVLRSNILLLAKNEAHWDSRQTLESTILSLQIFSVQSHPKNQPI